jgi:hypothetical protein
MKRIRETLSMIRGLRYVVHESLLLFTKLALLVGVVSAPIQLAWSYVERYAECVPQATPRDADRGHHNSSDDRAAAGCMERAREELDAGADSAVPYGSESEE